MNKSLEPFVEKITCLLNGYENLLNEKAVIEEKNTQLGNNVSNNINNTNLIEQLKNEISFLNNQNEIIKTFHKSISSIVGSQNRPHLAGGTKKKLGFQRKSVPRLNSV